ncbi:MAG: hypothetical protein AAB573_00245 [Patescibacteria group bacterium]
MFEDHIAYLKDNPKGYWFKARLYGWGWVPVRWQGWAVIGAYVVLMILLGLTIDEASPPREIAFTFFIPAAILTALLLRICYKKGERPHWQWGPPKSKK